MALQEPVRKRRLLRRYDPEDEIAVLRKKVEEERSKRRLLEQDLYKLKLERSDMCFRMSKLENSKVTSSVPSCLMPLLLDTMAKGLNPSKLRSEPNARLTAIQQAQQLHASIKPVSLPRANPPTIVRTPGGSPKRPIAPAVIQSPTRVTSPSVSAPKLTSILRPPVQQVAAPQQYVIQSREMNGKTVTFLVPIAPGEVMNRAANNVVSIINMTSQPIDQSTSVVDLTILTADTTLSVAAVAGAPAEAVPPEIVPAKKVLDIPDTTASPEESDIVDLEP